MPASLERRLAGMWFHSHEEEAGGGLVFRPSDFDFPPARGRVGYEFRADRTGDFLGIAARDGWARSSFVWRLRRGEKPAVVVRFADGREEAFVVVSADADRLVVKRE